MQKCMDALILNAKIYLTHNMEIDVSSTTLEDNEEHE